MAHGDETGGALGGGSHGAHDRRTILKRAGVLGLGAPVVAQVLHGVPSPVAAAFQSDGEASDDAEDISYEAGVYGGTLRIITNPEPPTLDIHQSEFNIVDMVAWNMFESLYAYDADFNPIPMLAESDIESSDDLLTHRIALRQGVLFHNGDEMVAADVVASIQRWMGLSGLASPLVERSAEVVATDDYAVEIRLGEPMGSPVHLFAMNQWGCPIYPQEICEQFGQDAVTEFIGTGPYRFVEWQPDRFIQMQRFDEYSALPGEPNGLGGHKYAFVDEMVFTPIVDEATRVAGLLAGDYDFTRDLSGDFYVTLDGASNLVVDINPVAWQVHTLPLNTAAPPLDNLGVRKAIQAAIAAEPAIIAREGAGFYKLDPSLMREGTPWYSRAGEEFYNLADPDGARALLEEAGYGGETIVVMANEPNAPIGQTVAQQLEEIGMSIEFLVLDSAARAEMLETNDWHVSVGGFPFPPEPTQFAFTQSCDFWMKWCDAESMELIDTLTTETDLAERFAAWEQWQGNVYEQAPFIPLGHVVRMRVRSSRLGGQFLVTGQGIPFWNMWLDGGE